MRRFDRSYHSPPQLNDERRVTLRKEGNWVRSSLENISTMHNELSATVARNYDNILIARQENVVIAENVRAAAAVYNQLSDRLSRIEDQIEFDKKSLDAVIKSTKQAESHVTGQQRQLVNKGLQMERNVSRLEEEIMRLKQMSEVNNKQIQTINEKIDETLQEMSKQTNTMDVGIQDLRQLTHEIEMNARKNVRAAHQEIEQKIDIEEKSRKSENNIITEKIQALQAVVNDMKKREKKGVQSYIQLVEEKDQEYKNELNNLFRKISAHIQNKQHSTNNSDKKLIHELTAKVRFLEQQLAMEKEARVESLIKLEDETARHFKKVSKDIISELDNLSSSLQNTHSKDHMETVIREMKKEIEANKQTINRVLRAEITARKSQAQKFSHSIQGVQKHSSQTVIVVQEAIQEMKTYVDKELGTKSISPDGRSNKIIPTFEKRLSDLEEKLTKHQTSDGKTDSSMKSPSSPEYEADVTRRLFELELKLSRQIELLKLEKSKKRGSDERGAYSSKQKRKTNSRHHSCTSKDRLLDIEQNINKLSTCLHDIELKINKFKRITTHEIRRERKIRNKFVEFINSRLLAGERLKIFVKSFGAFHMKYLTQDDGKQKLSLNIWGIYQAWRMYEYKRKWLRLINREPANLDLKEYRRITREEKINERLEAKKAEKKRKMSTFVIDSFSESSEESEKEEQPELKKIEEEKAPNEEAEVSPKKEEMEDGPKRINYEDHSDDNYIKYNTDEDEEDDETEDFFPVTSSEEDFKLFSDEDDDDDDTEEGNSGDENNNNDSDGEDENTKEEDSDDASADDKEDEEETEDISENEDVNSEEENDQQKDAQRQDKKVR